jgi:hypothetical protein
MNPFRRSDRSADPMWRVASKTQIFAVDEAAVIGLVRELDHGESGQPVDGVVVAKRHPTGWFVHAVRRSTLPPDQIGLFEELVTVRSYLLLAHGPKAPAWQPGPAQGEWRSPAFSISREVSDLEDSLVD